ncbi:farnesyl pyrophosphate synthase-like [Periplaneta americana]|uniref:farnesyl pyrophosphate synthase-like n=1 Tax=Periplaneta americana TaxID=6978 RepID=UPI0037E9A089
MEQRSERRNWHYEGTTSDPYFKRYAPACVISVLPELSCACAAQLHTGTAVRASPLLSTLPTLHNLHDKLASIERKECEGKEFMAVFEDIVRDLATIPDYQDSFEAADWLGKTVKLNVPGGKMARGKALVKAYKSLLPEQEQTPEKIRLSIVMALCVEMLQSSFQIVDDMMDDSTVRKNRPCWHRVNDIGMVAANDAEIVECAVYKILEKYFSDKPYYLDTLKSFHDITLKTVLGQALDVNVAAKYSGKVPDLCTYTMERYRVIVKYKTCYFTCCFPFALAMYMAGLNNEELLRHGNNILMEIGQFVQAYDDYLDCFGDPAVTGKIGTDIETRKCTWLIATAMQRATPEQKAVLEDCYGIKDPLKVSAVKKIYEELDLHSAYAAFVQEKNEIINNLIDQLPQDLPKQLFYDLMCILRM